MTAAQMKNEYTIQLWQKKNIQTIQLPCKGPRRHNTHFTLTQIDNVTQENEQHQPQYSRSFMCILMVMFSKFQPSDKPQHKMKIMTMKYVFVRSFLCFFFFYHTLHAHPFLSLSLSVSCCWHSVCHLHHSFIRLFTTKYLLLT